MEIFSMLVLGISGLLVFTFAGFLRLSNPIKNYLKNSGITLSNDVDTLSEVRGMSTVMMFGGILIAAGIFVAQLTFTSHVIAVLLFFGYATGRLISMNVDGRPNKLIINGTITEVILGAANLFLLIKILG